MNGLEKGMETERGGGGPQNGEEERLELRDVEGVWESSLSFLPTPGYLPQWQRILWVGACPGMRGHQAQDSHLR